MKKRILFLLLLAPGFVLAQVQTDRNVIASAGNNFSSLSLQVSQTVGESVVSDMSTVNLHLSQGFQQYVELPNAIPERDIVNDFTLYPNPVSDVLKVSFSADEKSDWNIYVTNLLGEVMSGSTKNLSNRTSGKVSLDCSEYPQGAYFVRLVAKDTGQSVSYKFLKIK